MQVDVKFLDNLRLEASFDDFKITTDQPVRYKGDGTAPSPFDYFLASSALCAGYFVKIYCQARNIPTEDIRIFQNNLIDPENRYNQTLKLEIELPEFISEKDRLGILQAMERCTVKRVIQNNPEFIIQPKNILGVDSSKNDLYQVGDGQTHIIGKDSSLENTIQNMITILKDLGINIEIASWRNPVPHVWSVHIRDAESPICYTNGKGSSKDAALASALGEYLERISNNYFYNDYYLGEKISNDSFVHYPNEVWFDIPKNDSIPKALMDETLLSIYDPEGELRSSHLIDTNSGNSERGICAIPFQRWSDKETVFIPVNLIGNLFVSNGMSAGNTLYEARVQCLSEIFERAVKNYIIKEELTLPDVPQEVINRYPKIAEGIKKLEEHGHPIFVKDASLGGKYPVISVTLMNPKTGGVFASFGAHPRFEVALERSLTELMQGRSFEGLNDVPCPTFNSHAVSEHNNIIDHFIDSTGVVSWKFFSSKFNYKFNDWDFIGTTQEEFNYLMSILEELEKEVYIADYEELGAKACRILVPDFSEIYEVDDLIWDNNNKALNFREDILNLHKLDVEQLNGLIEKFEDCEIDDYTLISELIGIAFEETSVWGQLTISELKCLIFLALGELERAKEHTEMLVNFSDNTPSRKKFFQALNIILEIFIEEELQIKDYKFSLERMYGEELIKNIILCIEGKIKFYGLTPTSLELEGLEKHIKLIASYEKLQKAKKKFHSTKKN